MPGYHFTEVYQGRRTRLWLCWIYWMCQKEIRMSNCGSGAASWSLLSSVQQANNEAEIRPLKGVVQLRNCLERYGICPVLPYMQVNIKGLSTVAQVHDTNRCQEQSYIHHPPSIQRFTSFCRAAFMYISPSTRLPHTRFCCPCHHLSINEQGLLFMCVWAHFLWPCRCWHIPVLFSTY